MAFATYEDLRDDKWTLPIREKFAKEIRQLKSMRFDEAYYIREIGQPFSLLPLLVYISTSYLIGRGSGIALLRAGSWLRFVAYQPYVVHSDGYAYGAVGYNRIKFATLFEDGTLLHTMNDHRPAVTNNDQHRFIGQFCLTETGHNGTFKDTWRMHIQRVERLAKTRAAISPLRVSDIIRMEMRADEIITGGMPESWDEISMKKDKIETDSH